MSTLFSFCPVFFDEIQDHPDIATALKAYCIDRKYDVICSGMFSNTLQLQKQLLADYEEDITKYAEGLDQSRILNVFRHIPIQLAKENKKFQISKVASGARFKGFDLYYYSKENSTLEEVFFVRNTENLISLEVKARNGNSKSLSTLIKSDSYPDIHFGIKLIDGNIGVESNIRTFPHYLVFLLRDYLKGE